MLMVRSILVGKHMLCLKITHSTKKICVKTTLIIPLSECYYSELCSAIMSCPEVQIFSKQKFNRLFGNPRIYIIEFAW